MVFSAVLDDSSAGTVFLSPEVRLRESQSSAIALNPWWSRLTPENTFSRPLTHLSGFRGAIGALLREA
ncbi:MAG: hypothetical protein KDA81_12635 [Planctomycetaceae bacterium]|nr:hypothetical protein [Planctomycetaceae bacterium]